MDVKVHPRKNMDPMRPIFVGFASEVLRRKSTEEVEATNPVNQRVGRLPVDNVGRLLVVNEEVLVALHIDPVVLFGTKVLWVELEIGRGIEVPVEGEEGGDEHDSGVPLVETEAAASLVRLL